MKGWRYCELLINHASFKNFRTFRAEQILDFLKVVRLVFWSGVVGPAICSMNQ